MMVEGKRLRLIGMSAITTFMIAVLIFACEKGAITFGVFWTVGALLIVIYMASVASIIKTGSLSISYIVGDGK